MKSVAGRQTTMLLVRLNTLKARQLEETLHAAGFTTQEVFVVWSESGSKFEVPLDFENASDLMCYLNIKTQTATDEDIAKAVLRDCGVDSVKTTPRLALPSRKALRDSSS